MSDVEDVVETVGQRLLRPAEVARLLGVSRDWVYRHANAGDLPVVRLGRGGDPRAPLRIDAQRLDAWIDEQLAPVGAA